MSKSSPHKISSHAVSRFQERVRPGISPEQARNLIGGLLADHTPSSEPPAWKHQRAGDNNSTYIEASDGICFILNDRNVVTVITRGWKPDYIKKRSKKAIGGHKRGRPADPYKRTGLAQKLNSKPS